HQDARALAWPRVDTHRRSDNRPEQRLERRVRRRRIERQCYGEGGTDAGRALDENITAHGLREPLDDGKAKPGPSELPRGRAVGLYEGLEQASELLRAHPDAGVGHGERCPGTPAPERRSTGAHPHATVFCELDGIA